MVWYACMHFSFATFFATVNGKAHSIMDSSFNITITWLLQQFLHFSLIRIFIWKRMLSICWHAGLLPIDQFGNAHYALCWHLQTNPSLTKKVAWVHLSEFNPQNLYQPELFTSTGQPACLTPFYNRWSHIHQYINSKMPVNKTIQNGALFCFQKKKTCRKGGHKDTYN